MTQQFPIVKLALTLAPLELTLRAVYNLACLQCTLSRSTEGEEQGKHLEKAWTLLLNATDEPALARRARVDPSLDPLRTSRDYRDRFEARFRKVEAPPPSRGLTELSVVGGHASALARLGITTVRQLRERLSSTAERAEIKEKLRLSDATVSRWCDVTELIEKVALGLGVRAANLLTAVGIFSLRDLAAVADGAELRRQLIDANKANPQLNTIVGIADVNGWIRAAQDATTQEEKAEPSGPMVPAS